MFVIAEPPYVVPYLCSLAELIFFASANIRDDDPSVHRVHFATQHREHLDSVRAVLRVHTVATTATMTSYAKNGSR